MAIEGLLVNGTTELLKKIGSIVAQEFGLIWGAKEEVKKLQNTLAMIQAVLHDAEKRQIEEEAVRLWLRRLKDLAYDAEDILDKLASEALRRKMEIQNHMSSTVRNYFALSKQPAFCLKISHKVQLAFRFKIAHQVNNINRKLDEIEKDRVRFRFQEEFVVVDTKIAKNKENRETYSFVEDSQVIGRENDKSKIVDLLFSSSIQETLSIIPIVGMGGLGKTTLARLVYNDESIVGHFDIKIWICVSDDFNVKRLLKEIIESVTGGDKCSISSMDLLFQKLQEKLKGKKFLLVLDDVWNKDAEEWEKLKNSLKGGIEGSVVIVTTRSEEVAEMMRPIVVHSLKILSDDECWSVFKQRAFGNGGAEETPNLVMIGREIVRKCKGVPLAAKALGGLMHAKKEEHEWISIQNHEIWNLPKDQSGILPALQLSYDHLSSPLKQCFSYCSLFPKDHMINKKKLIQLWVAEGFLQTPEENKVEDIGNEYFNTLLRNSFFQDAQKNKYGNITTCRMHDLVHDLSCLVRGFEDLTVEAEKPCPSLSGVSQVRRFSFVPGDDRVAAPPEAILKAKKLRTFLWLYSDLSSRSSDFDITFISFRSLRVLDLSRTNIKELSSSLSKLKQLRYLDLSWTKIEQLPDSITTLYNLQTLKLQCCYSLKELPKEMKRLINLRHLEIDRVGQRDRMLYEIGELSCLQTLPIFIVGQDKRCSIRELQSLNLRGELRIYNLENVRNGIEAKEANLKGKRNIHKLALSWERSEEEDTKIIDQDVLEGLQPQPNLKSLEIRGFHGMKIPRWMMNGLLPSNLVKIKLFSCTRWEHVPTLGHLPFLRVLHIWGLESVKRLDSKFYHDTTTTIVAFPSLEKLTLRSMGNLVEWLEVPFPSFPCLVELTIESCNELVVIPTLFPSLERLSIIDCNEMVLTSLSNKLTSLNSLVIEGCSDLRSLPKGLLQHNKLLRSLEIVNCPALTSLPGLQDLQSLQHLTILNCEVLKSLPEGLHCLTTLRRLQIGGFSEDLNSFPIENGVLQHLVSLRDLMIKGWFTLKSFPDQLQQLTMLESLTIRYFPSLVALPEWLGDLKSLRSLEICNCRNLMYLPEEGMKRLTTLQFLDISGSPLLKERCVKERGEEWYKIAHIPHIRFYLGASTHSLLWNVFRYRLVMIQAQVSS